MSNDPANVERARFPAVSAGQAVLGNCLAASGLGFAALIRGESRQMELAEVSACDESELSFVCRFGEVDAQISINGSHVQALLPEFAADLILSDLPEALLMAIATTVLQPIVAGLADEIDVPFQIGKLVEKRDATSPVLMIREIRDVGKRPVAVLRVSPDAAGIFATMLQGASTAPVYGVADRARVAVDAQFWSTTLTAEEISGLERGDVVLLPQGYPAERVELVARDARLYVGTGTRKGTEITIEQVKGTAHG